MWRHRIDHPVLMLLTWIRASRRWMPCSPARGSLTSSYTMPVLLQMRPFPAWKKTKWRDVIDTSLHGFFHVTPTTDHANDPPALGTHCQSLIHCRPAWQSRTDKLCRCQGRVDRCDPFTGERSGEPWYMRKRCCPGFLWIPI